MAAWPLRITSSFTPLLHIRPRYASANITITKPMSNSATVRPKISEGQDENKVKAELKVLLENGWTLNEEETQLEKTYHLKTYTKVLDLHTCIGVGSKSKNHHSKMITEFGSLTVHWTTHHPHGLSSKDTFMAGFCDEQAKLVGTVDKSEAQKCGPPPSSQM